MLSVCCSNNLLNFSVAILGVEWGGVEHVPNRLCVLTYCNVYHLCQVQQHANDLTSNTLSLVWLSVIMPGDT